jgi:hypothetical protein
MGDDSTTSNVVYLKPGEIALMAGTALMAAAESMDVATESAVLKRADIFLTWMMSKQG